MRYQNADDEIFTTPDGLQVTLKEKLPLVDKAVNTVTVDCNAETALDEIASRNDVYGEGMESEDYKIFDENIRELKEANFDLSRIKTLRVPV